MDETESARPQLEALLKRHKVPGCSVAARRGDQALSFRFGSADPADGRPVDDDTVFHLFSGTKLFTAMGATVPDGPEAGLRPQRSAYRSTFTEECSFFVLSCQ